MYIQVSKVFAKFMNETAKERNIRFTASVVNLTESQYRTLVDDPWENLSDYISSDELKVIRVEYPYEYYCSPRYISSCDLYREFRRNGVTTSEGLKDMICEMCEI